MEYTVEYYFEGSMLGYTKVTDATRLLDLMGAIRDSLLPTVRSNLTDAFTCEFRIHTDEMIKGPRAKAPSVDIIMPGDGLVDRYYQYTIEDVQLSLAQKVSDTKRFVPLVDSIRITIIPPTCGLAKLEYEQQEPQRLQRQRELERQIELERAEDRRQYELRQQQRTLEPIIESRSQTLFPTGLGTFTATQPPVPVSQVYYSQFPSIMGYRV